MDISYHYFAVKTLAREAGFDEKDAQTIASFSQYIDDFNQYVLRRYSNIPNYVKKSPYDLYIGNIINPANFNPATTGFWDKVDTALLVTSRSQKFTVSPFHFIPKNRNRVEANDRRAAPATLNDDSFIANMLHKARNNYLGAIEATGKKQALMHIGMLLHTFADTYAHQLFSGYNEKCNSVTLKSAVNNITGKDETEKYRKSIIDWLEWFRKQIGDYMPTIGHMMLNHIPDLTHLSFTMEYPLSDGHGNGVYSRSNTAEFVRVSKEIINFLRSCLQKDEISSNDWNELSPKIAQGFLIDISEYNEATSISALKRHWGGIFQNKGYIYEYDRTAILEGALSESSGQSQTIDENAIGKSMGDDYYRFNAFADELLIELYGAQPRKEWFNDLYQ